MRGCLLFNNARSCAVALSGTHRLNLHAWHATCMFGMHPHAGKASILGFILVVSILAFLYIMLYQASPLIRTAAGGPVGRMSPVPWR